MLLIVLLMAVLCCYVWVVVMWYFVAFGCSGDYLAVWCGFVICLFCGLCLLGGFVCFVCSDFAVVSCFVWIFVYVWFCLF